MNRPKYQIFLSLVGSVSLALAITPHALQAEEREAVSGGAIDRSVVAALSHQGVTESRVVSHINLTGPFQTKTQWTLVAVQDESHSPDDFEDHGPLYLCLVKSTSTDCDTHLFQQSSAQLNSLDKPYELFTGKIVYKHSNQSYPLLFLSVCGARSANGNCVNASALYDYNRATDRFVRVFLNFTGKNNNEATRFVESGPLQGNLIINTPTENAPYTYWIEVYRAQDSGQYGPALRYRGLTHYGDGNPLAVADSEMPEILRHFGFWHAGDPLPIPPHLPQGCKLLSMRKGEEWCK